ncbi:MAG TPA: DNA-binding protein [Patescibacteria group bacterium]|nr:DNA-binding protein [Patescibacteria group bacterium]
MVKMRTIKDALGDIKAVDPGTAVTKHYLRNLVITGAVPTVKAGNKYLINMDLLENYLSNTR